MRTLGRMRGQTRTNHRPPLRFHLISHRRLTPPLTASPQGEALLLLPKPPLSGAPPPSLPLGDFAEAPPVADEARRNRGSVPLIATDGSEKRLTRRWARPVRRLVTWESVLCSGEMRIATGGCAALAMTKGVADCHGRRRRPRNDRADLAGGHRGPPLRILPFLLVETLTLRPSEIAENGANRCKGDFPYSG